MINISKPSIGDNEIQCVNNAVASGWVSSQGEYIEIFERNFAEFCGVKHCVLVSNGTVSLHLALEVLNIGFGDEVIIPDLTFVATANVIKMAGATPVIADVRESDWCLDPLDVQRKITNRTKAIIPVHLYGHPAPMDELQKIASKHSLSIIEDAAEAHGARYNNKIVGGMSDFASFSFFANKIITTGEGGALTTNSFELAERARFLRDHGMSREKRYWYTEVGYNYRLTNMQAALGYAQLARVESFIEQREQLLVWYKRYMNIDNISWNPSLPKTKPVNWMTCLVINDFSREDRDRLIDNLKLEGIDSRPFFYTVSSLPMYQQESCPVSARLSASGLNLPTYPGLTEESIQFIAERTIRIITQIRELR